MRYNWDMHYQYFMLCCSFALMKGVGLSLSECMNIKCKHIEARIFVMIMTKKLKHLNFVGF